MPGYIVTASPNAVGTIMDKANTILVYGDYKSPYAFLAKDLIYELENKLDVDIEWLPYTLDIPILEALGRKCRSNSRMRGTGAMDLPLSSAAMSLTERTRGSRAVAV